MPSDQEDVEASNDHDAHWQQDDVPHQHLAEISTFHTAPAPVALMPSLAWVKIH